MANSQMQGVIWLLLYLSLIKVGLQINVGSGKNGGPGIFVTQYKEVFENSHFS